jgi:sarcosine oxidase subunit gamma
VFEWRSESAFNELLTPAGSTAGLTATERRGLQIATLMTLESRAEALSRMIEQHFRCALPLGPKRMTSGRTTFLGTGPVTWLVVAEPEENQLVARLEAAAHGQGWVADQSGGLGVLRLGGPRLLEVLSTGVQVDLDPAIFTSEDVAVTSIAHIGATLWRVDNAHVDLAVFRSMAGSFWDWLYGSAGRHGISVEKEPLSAH